MTLPCHYSPTADRAPSAAELERAWLEDIKAEFVVLRDKLEAGYPDGGDVNIEGAISDAFSLTDRIGRRMKALGGEE